MSAKMDYTLYKPEMDRVINDIFKRPHTRVLVAYAAHETAHILGFSVSEGSTLHYIFVKAVYRRMGVASGLLTSQLVTFSHKAGKAGTAFLRFHGLKYNPLAIVENKHV
jgi:hypothetical protein